MGEVGNEAGTLVTFRKRGKRAPLDSTQAARSRLGFFRRAAAMRAGVKAA